jgi:hypothetical protein
VVNKQCERCGRHIVEIDYWGERLTGCRKCNRWQASTGEWCQLAPDDIVALRALKVTKNEPSLKPGSAGEDLGDNGSVIPRPKGKR